MSKLRTLIFALAVSTSVIHGYCQEKPSILSHEIAPHWYVFNKPGYIVKTDNNVPLIVKDFIPICKEEFGLGERDELRPKDGFRATSTGVTKYQQYYDGYEVEDAIVIVESYRDTITMISAHLVRDLDLNTSSPISESEALPLALESIQETFDWQDSIFVNSYCRDFYGNFDSIRYKKLLPKGKLMIVRKFASDLKANNYKFVWSFYLSTINHLYRVLIDANTGNLFDVNNYTSYSINSGQFDTASVQTLYDGEHTMETYSFSPLQGWTLQNSNGNQTFLNGCPITNTDNVWNNDSTAPASTAHWIIGEMKGFYQNEFSNNNLVDSVLINAGINNFVASDYNHRRSLIRIGNIEGNWASTIDIIGHELAHRLNFQTANLYYFGESGALVESFADIFGTLAEKYIRESYGNSWNWTIGEDAGTVRDMANPSLHGQPEYYLGSNWHDTSDSTDYGGAHQNCGVQNKWFYLLSQNIGTDKAGHIAYNSLNLYLSPTSNYIGALIASVAAAENLYGDCSDERNAVISAWSSVGVRSYRIPECSVSGNENERLDIAQNDKDPFLIHVFPNPASNEISIELSEETEDGIITFYNMTGNEIEKKAMKGKKAVISTVNKPNGLYYISVMADGVKTNNAKVVISK